MVYFEHQDGALCAQHALNAVLQGRYFTAVEMAEIAQALDQAEQAVDSAQSQQRPSDNYDESGFFSVQVIDAALEGLDLKLMRWGSSEAPELRTTPEHETAFICNRDEHWFALRKLGDQWWNLDSVAQTPSRVSPTYLGAFLAQLAEEGYAVFAVRGNFPPPDTSLDAPSDDEEEQLRQAIAASLADPQPAVAVEADSAAPAPSADPSEPGNTSLSAEELRRRRLLRFGSNS